MRHPRRLALFAILAVLTLGSCGLLGLDRPEENDSTVNITAVEWAIESIPDDYYVPAATDNPPTCFINFWIYCSGDFSADEVESVEVFLPQSLSSWSIDPGSWVPASGFFGGWTGNFYTANRDVIPAGIMTAKVTLTNGATSELEFQVNRPGESDAVGTDFIATEDADTTGLGDVVPALKRATIDMDTDGLTATNLSFSFTVTDAHAVNGFILLYDAEGYYIGVSERFRHSITNAKPSWLNAGAGLNNAGGTNAVDITASGFTFATGKSFTDIGQYCVVLLDGAQYEPTYYGVYDYRSYSATAVFP